MSQTCNYSRILQDNSVGKKNEMYTKIKMANPTSLGEKNRVESKQRRRIFRDITLLKKFII